MLIEFRVENHRSLRDEQVLTLEARRSGGEPDLRLREIEGHSEPLLPAAVLYGANASGKSNVLSAIAFMRFAVLNSHRIWEPDSGIPRSPFAWGEKRNSPSVFEIAFVLDGTRVEYGFAMTDESVQEEWLYAFPHSRKQVWFERDEENFKFGDHLSGPNDLMKEVTRSNALFLSVASQHRHPQLSSVYSWFRSIAPVNIQGSRNHGIRMGRASRIWYGGSRYEQMALFDDGKSDADAWASRIRELLKAADTGIVDVKRVEAEEDSEGRVFQPPRIQFKHQFENDDSWLDLDQESEGTKTLFRMASPIFDVLESGGILLVDELESNLHPLLGLKIVQLFNCPKTNSKNAQIVFSTHDTNLLGTTLGEPPLRRDQIWFTEKSKEGASNLYPLTDYKPRKSENLERGYLQGRYGGIPFLGDITWVTEPL